MARSFNLPPSTHQTLRVSTNHQGIDEAGHSTHHIRTDHRGVDVSTIDA